MKHRRFHRLFGVLILALLLALPGCATAASLASPTAKPAAEATAEPTAAPTMEPTAELTAEPTAAPSAEILTDAALLASLQPHLRLLLSCYLETYGAELDRETAYARVYASADDLQNGVPPIDVVERASLTGMTDPIDATLYRVTSFSTNREALDHMKQYMTAALAEAVFPAEFLEFDGALYMVYGSRGYGANTFRPEEAVLTARADDACTVSAPFCYFEETAGTLTVEFQNTADGWRISAVTEPQG